MRFEVLDHGYIELVESWGSDEGIIEAARMSTGKGFQGWGPICGECGRQKEKPGDLCAGGCGRIDKPGDEKLLGYLWKNQHTSPFEMAGAMVEVKAPIFVFREWHRHRTQCLGPDTLVHFESPKGDKAGRRFVYKMRIEDVWRKWQPTKRAERPERQTNALFPRERIRGMRLRCLDEERKEFVQTHIADVIRGEPKPMVKVTTASGRSFVATREHRVLTNFGWVALGKAVDCGFLLTLEGTARGKAMRWERPPVDESREEWRQVIARRMTTSWPYQVSSEGRVRRIGCEPKNLTIGAHGYDVASLSWQGHSSAFCVHTLVLEAFRGARQDGQEARHLNSNRADNRLENLEWGTPAENARDRVDGDRQQRLTPIFEEIVEAVDIGDLPTFDLAVDGPWHNFVADGFVVHNSFNEMSARYSPLPDENYLPTVARLMLSSSANKQAGTAAGAEPLTAEGAESFRHRLSVSYEECEEEYQRALSSGVPKELARLVLPVGRYSRMRAGANLWNWLRFLKLRMAAGAQWEIRMYAEALSSILRDKFPRTVGLFLEGQA